jgi:ribosomal protein S18 acetylase RimI-like enzyme
MSRVLDRFSRRMDVIVRHCEPRDLPQLEWLGSFTPHRLFMREQFDRHRRGENVMLVADHAAFPVGQVWIDLAKRAAEHVAIIWALRVIASAQGLGIGRRLLTAAERVARAAGFDVAEIGVERDNPRVRIWYERIGYRYVRHDLTEQTYVSPDGALSRHVFDQTILRRELGVRPTRS